MSDLTTEELEADIRALLDILAHPIMGLTMQMNAHIIAQDLGDETCMRFNAISLRLLNKILEES